MKHLLIVSLGFIVLALSACTKEGEGGAASITGKVMVRLINENTLDTLTTYEAQDERVYLIYGDNTSYDDDTRTTYNGNFKFDYLYKGDYTVYVYSECTFLLDDCPNETKAIVESVSISKASEDLDLGEIIIDKYTK